MLHDARWCGVSAPHHPAPDHMLRVVQQSPQHDLPVGVVVNHVSEVERTVTPIVIAPLLHFVSPDDEAAQK